MKVLYFDCPSGISGDMTVGALLDLGVDAEEFKRRLALLGLEGEYSIRIRKKTSYGIAGTDFCVDLAEGSEREGAGGHKHWHRHGDGVWHAHEHEHGDGVSHVYGQGGDGAGHEHEHEGLGGHSPNRNINDIRKIITGSGLSGFVKEKALAAFEVLAEAEAMVHGTTVDKVHFHEVGAVDAIVDIVGAFIAMEMLGAEAFEVSPINVGSGTVKCAHGVLPVPAPATAELLRGIEIYSRGEGELCTPTGAAIARQAKRFGPIEGFKIEKAGYGFGKRDTGGPNCLRVFLGEKGSDCGSIIKLETNVDDMTGEALGHIMGRLFGTGALDAFFTPVIMKKNRPGVMITVLCKASDEPALTKLLLRETTTLGVRKYAVEREVLMRKRVSVMTEYGVVDVKIADAFGEIKAAPEYESCHEAAEKAGVPFIRVYESARSAAMGIGKEKLGEDGWGF